MYLQRTYVWSSLCVHYNTASAKKGLIKKLFQNYLWYIFVVLKQWQLTPRKAIRCPYFTFLFILSPSSVFNLDKKITRTRQKLFSSNREKDASRESSSFSSNLSLEKGEQNVPQTWLEYVFGFCWHIWDFLVVAGSCVLLILFSYQTPCSSFVKSHWSKFAFQISSQHLDSHIRLTLTVDVDIPWLASGIVIVEIRYWSLNTSTT